MPTESIGTEANSDAPRRNVVLLVALVLLFPPVTLLAKRAMSNPDEAAEFERETEKARRLLDAKQARASLVPIERASRLRPNAFSVHNNRCVAYGLLERKEEAVAACRRALEIEPTNQMAKNNLAWVGSIEAKATP